MDDQLRKIFSEKLGGYESAVRPELMNVVLAKVSVAGTGVIAGGTSALLKAKALWIVVIAIAAGTVATVIISSDKKEQQTVTVSKPQVSQESTEIALPITPDENKNSDPKSGANTTTQKQVKPLSSIASAVGTAAETNTWKSTSETERNEEVQTSNHRVENPGNENLGAPQENQTGQKEPNTATEKEEILTAAFNPKVISEQDLRFFFIPENAKAAFYTWDFGDGSTSDKQSPTHQYTSEGEYKVALTVTTANGETNTMQKTLVAEMPASILMPDIFSPNGDGKNDVFEPKEISEGSIISDIAIYDANGNIIFRSNGSSFWDGSDRSGNLAAGGTYRFVVTAQDKHKNPIESAGYVTLQR